jgi:small subunit ribosomal protein S3Ae
MIMAKQREIKSKRDKWKKKSFYSIVSPKIFGGRVIGETPALKKENLMGRTLYASLSDLIGDIKHFQTKVKLRIKEVDGQNAKTEYIGQEVLIDKITRIVRKWSSKIESVDDVSVKNRKFRIKTLIITKRRVNTSLKNTIRHDASAIIGDYFKDKSSDQIITDINTEKIQRIIKNKINKLYPLRAVEIRKTEFI